MGTAEYFRLQLVLPNKAARCHISYITSTEFKSETFGAPTNDRAQAIAFVKKAACSFK